MYREIILLIFLFQNTYSYGIFCENLDGVTCTHYQSCSWQNGKCGHNHCVDFNVTTCDDQPNCHYVEGCNNCVENCNDSTDCFFSQQCKFGVFCKMTKERKRLGCAIMDTPQPVPEPTYAPSAISTGWPTLSPSTYNPSNTPTTYPHYHDPYGERFNNPSPYWPTTEFPTTNPTLHPSRFPTPVPSDSPTYTPTKTPTESPSLRPSFRPTPDPTFVPAINPSGVPTTSPTEEPTFGPLPYPTSSPQTWAPTRKPSLWGTATSPPSISNGDDGEFLQVGRKDDGNNANTNTTGGATGGLSRDDKIIMAVITSVGGMVLITGLLATYLRRLTKKRKNTPALSIEIPITPHNVIEWPTRRYSECTPQLMKRRSNTYPRERSDSLASSASSPRRPRLHSGISLGDLSRGGEPYGEEVDILIDNPS